ncbi:ribbon-helix-helix domain-containing protein (plasmid) [Limosilactobacillus reuteri]
MSTKLKRITVSLRNEDVEILEKIAKRNRKPLSKNLVNYFRLGVKRSRKTNTDYLKFQSELQNLNNEIRKLGININQISANLNYAKKHGGMNDVINQVYSNYDYSDKILFLTMDIDKLIEKVARASGQG